MAPFWSGRAWCCSSFSPLYGWRSHDFAAPGLIAQPHAAPFVRRHSRKGWATSLSGWIKFEKSLRDDPRVLRMARQLSNADVTHARFTSAALVTLVLGGLTQLWCYADTHIREGDILDLGIDEIDEVVGVQGFCNLIPADWLEVIDTEHVKLPGFLTHNGTEARKKALTQKRVARHRATVTDERNEDKRTCNADALPDLDQTRPRPDQKNGESRAARSILATRLPDDFGLTPERRAIAQAEKADPEREFAQFTDHFRSAPGVRGRKTDWEATWRNWCRRAPDFKPRPRFTTGHPEDTGWRPAEAKR